MSIVKTDIEILSGRIDWREGTAQNPEINLLVSRLPEDYEFVYRLRDGVYFGEFNGFSKFYCLKEKKSTQMIRIRMDTGYDCWLTGPIVPSISYVNSLGFSSSIRVGYTASSNYFYSNIIDHVGNITTDFLEKYLHTVSFPVFRGSETKGVTEFPTNSRLKITKCFIDKDKNCIYPGMSNIPDGSGEFLMMPLIQTPTSICYKFGPGGGMVDTGDLKSLA